MSKLISIKFTRDTLPGESDILYKKDQTVELTESSADRWLRRLAAEIVVAKKATTVKKRKVSVKKSPSNKEIK